MASYKGWAQTILQYNTDTLEHNKVKARMSVKKIKKFVYGTNWFGYFCHNIINLLALKQENVFTNSAFTDRNIKGGRNPWLLFRDNGFLFKLFK